MDDCLSLPLIEQKKYCSLEVLQVEIPQLMGNCILFQESCVVALDMYKYEQSNEFQYADSLVKLQEK